MSLIKVGVYCLRGGGHWACYDDDDAWACGSKGPDVYIDVDLMDYHLYPAWLQELIHNQPVSEAAGKPQDRGTASAQP